MSDTPRTDAKCKDYAGVLCNIGGEDFIPADFARTLERELAECQGKLKFARRLLEVGAEIEEEFVDGSAEKAVAEITRLRGENEYLHDLISAFEWQRINSMSIAEVEKELLDAGYTKERLDASLAKIRVTVENAMRLAQAATAPEAHP